MGGVQMIQKLRSVVAFVLATFLMLITWNRIRLDRSGRATAVDDTESARPAVTRRVDRDDTDRDSSANGGVGKRQTGESGGRE